MKLNSRQHELLTLIDDHTKWEGATRPGTDLKSYWCPTKRSDWSNTLKRSVYLLGAGDASSIKSLIRKGFAVSISNVHKYGCAITEFGITALEKYRREHNV